MNIESLTLLERLRAQRTEIQRVAARYGAGALRVFGSVAEGSEGVESDVDLLVTFEPEASLLDQVGLSQDLEELLGTRVDVVTEAGLHWFIRDRVIADAVPL